MKPAPLTISTAIALLTATPVWAQAQAPETGAWLFWTIVVLAVIGILVAVLVKRR
jgi:hypothetical protein